MKKIGTIILLGCMMIGTVVAQPTPVYVGSFSVNQGPDWTTNPPVYSGQEAAALLFGGSPGDYAISTNSSTTDPGTITNTAWYDGYGMSCTEFAETFSADVAPPGYQFPGGDDSSWSAYVSDHGCSQVNYVWRVNGGTASQVPTMPLYTLALTVLGLLMLAIRRIRASAKGI